MKRLDVPTLASLILDFTFSSKLSVNGHTNFRQIFNPWVKGTKSGDKNSQERVSKYMCAHNKEIVRGERGEERISKENESKYLQL